MHGSVHPGQDDRLAALRRYEILNTPREREYDEVVEFIAALCNAPIAAMNLIDADRQWFKAEVGLGMTETPLETSLCQHVVVADDFVEIPDTHRDDRTKGNPLCSSAEKPVRFYAGTPLRTEEGLLIGTLCVLDYEPRRLTALQRDALTTIADLLMRQLDLRLSLRNQEILRRESDHRVKNSLANVAAMLNLQAGGADDPAVKAALADAGSRIHAAALLHREMHQAGSGQVVDLRGFMDAIEAHLQHSAPPSVSLEVSVASRDVPFEVAASLASIVTEFALNSFKHGFPDGRHGTVRVEGFDDDGTLVVEGFDDGVGTAASADERAVGSGLGRLLMQAAADRVGATLENTVDPEGAWFVFRLAPVETRRTEQR